MCRVEREFQNTRKFSVQKAQRLARLAPKLFLKADADGKRAVDYARDHGFQDVVMVLNDGGEDQVQKWTRMLQVPKRHLLNDNDPMLEICPPKIIQVTSQQVKLSVRIFDRERRILRFYVEVKGNHAVPQKLSFLREKNMRKREDVQFVIPKFRHGGTERDAPAGRWERPVLATGEKYSFAVVAILGTNSNPHQYFLPKTKS